ncbi:hypothetical protein C8R47DRAFT_1216050 [Mycena vitilis]|nr:hypothetical protein C8R47DRAFT_1216050 [Mycena vitilis]
MDDVEKGSKSSSAHSSPGEHHDLEASCAKIWSVYISEAEKYDKALVKSWRGDMDGMLIFTGLFSASLTAFIIESYKTLTPDSVTSVICNILWLLSLGLSLACALIATLVEQWARDFVQKTETRPSPVIRARIFSYLYYGLKRFNMHVLVDLVPFLLHMSLVLFFAGLVAFLLPISRVVTAVSIALLGIVVAIYCSLTILPLVYFDYPYRTPLSSVLWRVALLLSSRIAAVRFGGSREDHIGSSDETMTKDMVIRANQETTTQPSAERDQRDRQSLCWTAKSLVGPDELEPFIDSIHDVLWGPNGRKYTHDHLIYTLLNDAECEKIIAAGCIPSFDAVQAKLDQLGENSRFFCRLGVVPIDDATARKLSAGTPTSLSDVSAWFQGAWTFLRTSEAYWDDVRHAIIYEFLGASLSPPEDSQFSPPSAHWLEKYSHVLSTITHFAQENADDGRRHNTAVLANILSIFFPLEKGSRPTITLDGIDDVISALVVHVSKDYGPLFEILQLCGPIHIWAALMDYLGSGCPRSNKAETTLELMWRLDQGFWRMRWIVSSAYLGHDLHFHQSMLSTLRSIPDCPPLPSLYALVKTRLLVSLQQRQFNIFFQLLINKNIRCTPELHEKVTTRLLEDSPLAEAFISICLPTASENTVPSQSDWDECKSMLLHPLLSDPKLILGDAADESDPKFDYQQCEDDADKITQYLYLFFTGGQRIKAAHMVLYAEFLEACSSPTTPYNALRTLIEIEMPLSSRVERPEGLLNKGSFSFQTEPPLISPTEESEFLELGSQTGEPVAFNLFLSPRAQRVGFFNGVLALMEARYTTPEHTTVWRHLMLDSPILGTAVFEEAQRSFSAFDIPVRPATRDSPISNMLVIKDALTEYAGSINIQDSSEKMLKARVQEFLSNLTALLDIFPTVPVE